MTKYNWANEEQFLKDWSESNNKCDFLLRRNLTATSGNYGTLNRWLKFHTEKTKQIHLVSYEQVLIKGSPCNTKIAKKIVESNNLLPYKCSECDNEGIWNNKPLTLQLEHKNGINNDHRLENLEYLCPNCHTQTSSYGGKNIHSKLFIARLPTLEKLKIIKVENLIELSNLWKVNINRVKAWLNTHHEKLITHNIRLEDSIMVKQKKSSGNKITNVKLLNVMKKNRLHDIEVYKDDSNILQVLSVKWSISRNAVKKWIIKNSPDFAQQNSNVQLEGVKEIPQLILNNRFTQVAQLTNKKQVLALSKEWDTSVNGAKKWIRRNMPEKFLEIYDDSLLEKNKKLAIKNKKKDYIKSITLESFDLDYLTQSLSINKATLYAIIKRDNPTLYEQLMPSVVCKYCQSRTRTSGSNKDGETRYRCLSKECDRSFTL